MNRLCTSGGILIYMKNKHSNDLQRIDDILRKYDITKYGLLRNSWLWAHISGGLVLGKVINLTLPGWQTVLAVFIIAIAWEIFEHFVDTPTHAIEKKLYGSVRAYWFDTIADVLGATVAALIVVL